MSHASRAQTYRNVADRLRKQAAIIDSAEIRATMEATARQYDRLAEGIEMANSEIRQIQH
jgi:hypothetical protein